MDHQYTYTFMILGYKCAGLGMCTWDDLLWSTVITLHVPNPTPSARKLDSRVCPTY